MSELVYKPESHFFVDHTALKNAEEVSPDDANADAFGLVEGNLNTQYRTTSFVRAKNKGVPEKVFAVCEGRILIQPMVDDGTKVNLILKPETSYFPLKIKYFIYRGVNKIDLLDNTTLIFADGTNISQPAFLKEMWDSFKRYNIQIPTVFPPYLVGYDLDGSTLIDVAFNQREGNDYQLPRCCAGMHIGYFTDKIGLDIVLDDGDYQLEHQEELFKFDLKYARKSDNVFNSASKPAKYKEYILRFMDAAAFWGSHMNCGVIKVSNPEVLISDMKLKTSDEIYNGILSKYQTKDKVYIHIIEERGRSYSYYDNPNKRKVYFGLLENPNAPNNPNNYGQYNTNGWPILIKNYASQNVDTTVYGRLEYKIDNNILEAEQFIAIDVFAPSNSNSQKNIERIKNIEFSGTGTHNFSICTFAQANNVCASFIFINCNFKQEFPLVKYYNNLWTANIKSTFPNLHNSDDNNLTFWCTYDKNRVVNLENALVAGATIQNKVVFDTGTNMYEKRRLYIAAIKDNTLRYNKLNTDNFNSCFCYGLNYDEYIQNLYDYDNDFVVHKKTYNVDNTRLNLLTLSHKKEYFKNYSFFQLGITDCEYNTLIAALPECADNLFFYLEEIESMEVVGLGDLLFKYKLGLTYEDYTTGEMCQQPCFPASDIYIYALDRNYYFFSKDFSDYQHLFCSKYSAVFRTKPNYDGNFGFDWMRDGDISRPVTESSYELIVGKRYKTNGYREVVDANDASAAYFLRDNDMFLRLEKEYNLFNIKFGSHNEKYYEQMLTIYPTYNPAANPDLDKQTIFGSVGPNELKVNREAELILKISITEDNEYDAIDLEYDHSIFDIVKAAIPKTAGEHFIDITIKCIKEFSKKEDGYIDVVACKDNIEKIIGRLKVMPNAEGLRRKKRIVLIPVKTNINGGNDNEFNDNEITEIALNLKKFLRQGLITPVFEKLSVLNMKNRLPSHYIHNTGYKNVINRRPVGKPLLDEFLYAELKKEKYLGTNELIDNRYDDISNDNNNYIKLFLVKEEEDSCDGYSSDNFVVCFHKAKDSPAVPAHEVLHSLELAHSFTAKGAAKGRNINAEYTYKPGMTDNIMDYVVANATSLWEWQAKIARENSVPEKP